MTLVGLFVHQHCTVNLFIARAADEHSHPAAARLRTILALMKFFRPRAAWK